MPKKIHTFPLPFLHVNTNPLKILRNKIPLIFPKQIHKIPRIKHDKKHRGSM